MKSINAVVRELLARHLDRDTSTIHESQLLEEGLDLTPLELVLIALDVEEIEDVHVPYEELASLRTVGDLLYFFADTVVRARLARQIRGRAVASLVPSGRSGGAGGHRDETST